MSAPSNILIIRLSSLGDVLMCIPAVTAIRNAFPKARISWLVEGSVTELLRDQGFIDEVIEFPRRRLTGAIKKRDPIKTIHEAHAFVKNLKKTDYDIIVDFHGIAKSTILAWTARGKQRIGFGKTYAKEMSHLFYNEIVNGDNKRIHKVEKNMLIASHLGADRDPPLVRLGTNEGNDRYIDDFFSREGMEQPVFAINPFSSGGSVYKRWDLGRYGKLIRKINDEMEVNTLVLWGPGEEKEARRLVDMGGKKTILACPTSVPQLFSLIKKVDLYIGGDTGVMHLAAFAGTPLVAIFGPTDLDINGPWCDRAAVIRRDLPCSPCKNRRCENRVCLMDISVDEVFQRTAAACRQ